MKKEVFETVIVIVLNYEYQTIELLIRKGMIFLLQEERAVVSSLSDFLIMDFLNYNSSYISKTRIHGRRKVLSFEWSPSCVFDLSSAVATKMVLWSV